MNTVSEKLDAVALKNENDTLKIELAKTRLQLEKSVSWHQTILDSIPYPIFIKDSKHIWVEMNKANVELLGEEKTKLIGKSDFDFLPEEQAQIFWEKDSEVLINNNTNWNEEELTVKNKKHKLLTAKVRIEDAEGNPYVLGVISDITNKKNSIAVLQKKNDKIQEQKESIETLLKEVHHRVKNNLQIVISLLGLQKAKFSDENLQMALQDSRNRIMSMASVHEMLYKNENLALINLNSYLANLIDNLNLSFPNKDNRDVSVAIDQLHVNPDLAIPIGLIINEIFTNSIKYFGKQDYRLNIYVKLISNEKSFDLKIGDNGPGLSEDFDIDTNKSLGIELILLLVDQLDAKLEYHGNDKGLHYLISFARA